MFPAVQLIASAAEDAGNAPRFGKRRWSRLRVGRGSFANSSCSGIRRFFLPRAERNLKVDLAAGHGFAALVVGTFLFYLSIGKIEAEKEQRELRSAGKLSPGVSWNEPLGPKNVEVELRKFIYSLHGIRNLVMVPCWQRFQ